MTTTPVHQPLVRQPSLWTCCSAIAHAPIGLVRPRRPDRDFLDQLVDAGLPAARQTAKIVALQQVPKWVPTAGIVEGSRSPRRVAIAMTAFVVEHPRARFVVDPGMCADVGPRVISQLPRVLRAAVRPPADAIPTAVALGEHTALGERTADFALPTHLHWDHVCGLLDLPSMPVHVHRPELEWINTGVLAPVGGVRDALHDRPISTYALDGPPVATFERSHDLFGDGSVVLVDLAGHTPGSVGVLISTASGWVLLAGDAAWHSLQIEDVRQKSSYPGAFADEDRDACFRSVHRLHAVKDQMRIVPTHDHCASAELA
jgi:glyoxylase-like metal-dependent hydrolase (beta-lactamase superfamily II)